MKRKTAIARAEKRAARQHEWACAVAIADKDAEIERLTADRDAWENQARALSADALRREAELQAASGCLACPDRQDARLLAEDAAEAEAEAETGATDTERLDFLEGLRRDAARLDWLDAQGDGSPWIARKSETGRGYRLHNSFRGSATVREAIDKAREEAAEQ